MWCLHHRSSFQLPQSPHHLLLSENSSDAEPISFPCACIFGWIISELGFHWMVSFMNFRMKIIQSYGDPYLCTSSLSPILNLKIFLVFRLIFEEGASTELLS